MGTVVVQGLPTGDEVAARAACRKFLCVGDAKLFHSFLPEISSFDWHGVVVPEIKSATEALRGHGDVRVALVWVNSWNYEAVQRLVSQRRDIEWIALLQDSDLKNETIRDTISASFYDYHTLPVDPDRLLILLGHAYGMAALRSVTPEHDSRDGEGHGETHCHHMVGLSERMRSIYSTIDKVAPTDFPVLITGKSGTGKELVASAIHDKSRRQKQPFVVFNCGAVVPSLIQSELFGHEKGSFTSADRRRQGYFEAAHGGTIFLDEIGELPIETQVNLLRILEERVVRRVGGSRDIPIDVRVIAATNRDLLQAVDAGAFREDLFYRLSVVHVEVPPLIERRKDIEPLAQYYLERLAPDIKSRAKGFSKKAVEVMLMHSWPGNVRELINRIKRAALLCEDRLINPDDLGLAALCDGPCSNDDSRWLTLKEIKEEAERDAVVRTLSHVKHNVSAAAQLLGVSRVTLYSLLKKHDLR